MATRLLAALGGVLLGAGLMLAYVVAWALIDLYRERMRGPL